MSPSHGGKIITTLPPPEETKRRRSDVSANNTLVYTQPGYAFPYGNNVFPASPEDKAASLKYVSEEMPKILDGWKAGQGSLKTGFKTQKLRILGGGLAKVEEGLRIMKEGAYGREKLVYTIA